VRHVGGANLTSTLFAAPFACTMDALATKSTRSPDRRAWPSRWSCRRCRIRVQRRARRHRAVALDQVRRLFGKGWPVQGRKPKPVEKLE